jgi:hypothetical protein
VKIRSDPQETGPIANPGRTEKKFRLKASRCCLERAALVPWTAEEGGELTEGDLEETEMV